MNTWRCGLDWLGSAIGWEFCWIGGDPGEQQFVVGKIIDHGLPLIVHGWLGHLEDFFSMDEINMIENISCDGIHVGRLESSLDCDVAYQILEGFPRVIFNPGG